ncbi:MAG: hypothetical protein IJO93_03750 [Clostridia bacterium]|nr:hypothetical protein [Clostridia bacterium]
MKKSVLYRDLVFLFGGAVLFFLIVYVSLVHMVQVNLSRQVLTKNLQAQADAVLQLTCAYQDGELNKSAYEKCCNDIADHILFVQDSEGNLLHSENAVGYDALFEAVCSLYNKNTNTDISSVKVDDDTFICVAEKSAGGESSARVFACAPESARPTIIDTVSKMIILSALVAGTVMLAFFLLEIRYIIRLREKHDSESEEKEIRNKILQSMADAVLAVNENGKVFLTNSHADCLHITDSTGTNITDDVIKTAVAEVLNGKSHSEFKHELNEHIFAVITDMYTDGENTGCVVVMRDITESEKTENMRNAFVSNVSHELRAPLTVIKGFAQNLQENAPSMTEEKKNRYYKSMVSEVDRLSRLVTDMLFLSKLDSGVIRIETEVLDISYCVKLFADFLATICKEKDIESRINVPEQALAMFDYDRFRQILMILVENAVKFTPNGGSIEIGITDAKDIHGVVENRVCYFTNPQTELENGRLFIYVKDTGCGVEEHKLERIFERFYTQDKSHSTGSGLGLSLAEEMLMSVGETAVAASLPEKGSVMGFTLRIPTEEELSRAEE